MKRSTSPYIGVRKSGIHNKGVFAKKFIPKGTRIIEYIGDKVTKKESDKRADVALDAAEENSSNGMVYIFELNKKYDIDGNVPYNTAKFINHSCSPNCEVDILRGHIWVTAIDDIPKAKELSYNYGYDFDDYQDHPCKCGTPRCVGYIIDESFWPKLYKHKNLKKKPAQR